ncbi:MAG: cytochrome c oxidase subunit II [Acidobacteriia bacterium]|nr:cytochrome c oxidase subunit II [Terriglobia bacterium]
MWQTLPLWPARASTLAGRTDALMIFMLAVTGFFTVMIFILILVFALRFRRTRNPIVTHIEGSNALEAAWTLIPFGIFMVMFIWSAGIYMTWAQPPPNAEEVFVVGKQWMWKFEHPEGQREIDQLHVPLGRAVRLTMISQDVIHSLFLPEFRVKQDVLPGRYTTTWFQTTKPGSYHLFCTQYCGTMHSGMIGEVVVMEPAAYQAWLSGGNAEGSLASTGQKLFQQLGCTTCHRFDTQGRGPNLLGLYGKPVLLDDGRTVTADDNYIRESILTPGAKVVAGFKPIMPTFQGIVNEEQLLSLAAYLKSLSQPERRQPGSNRPAEPPHPASAPARSR